MTLEEKLKKLGDIHPNLFTQHKGLKQEFLTIIQQEIAEAKEEGFNAGCDYTTEQYENTLAEVSKVYCELTDNKLSKPNYKAEVILDEIRLQQDKDIEDAVKEAVDEACKKAKIEENERWKLLAEKDEVDCHESFFISRISELWENASPKESE